MDPTYQYGHRNPAFNDSFEFSSQIYYQNQDSPHQARNDLMLRRQRKTRQRVCLIIIAVVVVLIIVAVTIGVYMVVSGNKNDQKDVNMEFQASITVTNINWMSAYDNTGSNEYKTLSSTLKQEVEDGLRSSSMSSQFSYVDITGIRQGSVIFDMTIYMTSRKGTREISTSTVMDTLQTVVEKSKHSYPGSLLAGVHSISMKDTSSNAQLVVQLPTTTTTTVQPPITHFSTPLTSTTTHIPTTVATTKQTITRTTTSVATTEHTTKQREDTTTEHTTKQREDTTTSTTVKTTTSSTTPIITTTTTSKASTPTTSSTTTTTLVATTSTGQDLVDNDGPCKNETYLESILLSNCLDFAELGQVTSKSETEKCKFIRDAVDCVVKKVLDDTGAVCTDEHKANVLAKYNNILQLYLGVDGNTCFNFG